MTMVPLRRGTAAVALSAAAATLAVPGATAQTADGGLQPREIAARAQASLLVVRAIAVGGDTVGEGTGFVVGPGGTFVTNYHVIEPASHVEVQPLDGGATRDVLLVAVDTQRDLAVLRAPGLSIGVLPLGVDSLAVTGDRVYVMGNPLGMSGTFADGLVSARRPVQGTPMLQISAPISPGSSGGPVMNERGEVIGVASMMVVGGQNISLAVPIRYVRPLLVEGAEPRPFTASVLPSRAGFASLASTSDRSGPPVDRWRAQVLRSLDVVDSVMKEHGLSLARPARLGAVAEGQQHTEEFQLEAGYRYFIAGRCDQDCTDLDLLIIDGRGRPVAADAAPDDAPVVAFEAAHEGTYRAVVSMAACTPEPCAYGVAVYRLEPRRVSVAELKQ